MGADFVCAIIRKRDKAEVLTEIDALPEDVLLGVAEDCWGSATTTPEEVRDFLREAVEVCEEWGYRRDTGMIHIEQPGTYLITGGMTWGDDPTEAYKYLWALEAAGLG